MGVDRPDLISVGVELGFGTSGSLLIEMLAEPGGVLRDFEQCCVTHPEPYGVVRCGWWLEL